MNIDEVFQLIHEERAAQDRSHGGQDHDNQLTPHQWLAIALRHLGMAYSDEGVIEQPRHQKQLIRAVAVLVAYLEQQDQLIPFDSSGRSQGMRLPQAGDIKGSRPAGWRSEEWRTGA